MKKIVFAFTLVMCAFTVNSKTSDNDKTPFRFPFSQGDAKWDEFKTPQDRISALQIPEKTLALISTEDLLFICLDYPYLSDVFAFDNMDLGVKAVASKFNGFHEFLTRQDQIEVLEKVFQRILSDKLFLCDNSDKRTWSNSKKMFIISYLLGRPEILNKLTSSQKENLLQITQGIIDTLSLDSVLSQTLGYSALNTLKQSLSGSSRMIYDDYMSVTRYTPNGSSVLAWQLFRNEFSVNEKDSLANDVVNNFGVTIVSEATRIYNCHAFAWHMTEGGDGVWIGMGSYALTDENIYWEDLSYIEVPESLATKVSYDESTANHSAIRLSSNLYRSKWGSLPLVDHAPNVCPYDTSMPKKYYAKPAVFGPSMICGSSTETYLIGYPPSGYNVYWSIDNSNFSITPSGGLCYVDYIGSPQYDIANLTAIISWQGQTIKTLTKQIMMQGASLNVTGWQYEEVTSNGMFPNRQFTIPANKGSMTIPDRFSMDDIFENDSLPIEFVEDNIRGLVHPPVDLCGYGVTEINGGNGVYLNSTRFNGMNISFSGSNSPTYYNHNGNYVTFEMPYNSFDYPVTLHATSDAQCHDFCLTFNVVPLPGTPSGDDEIWVNLDGSMLYVTFFGTGGEPIGNGQYYLPNYSVTITKIPGGTQVYSNNFPGTQSSFSVNTSTWTSGIYSIRIVQGNNIYTKSICL